MSITKRLSMLERRSEGAGLSVIRIVGGLPAGSVPMTATAGGYRWRQDIDETEDAFADRVVALAVLANETILIIGGLPSSEDGAWKVGQARQEGIKL